MFQLIESTFIILLLIVLIMVTVGFMIAIYRIIRVLFFFKKVKNKLEYVILGTGNKIESSVNKLKDDPKYIENKELIEKTGERFNISQKIESGKEFIKKTKKMQESFFSKIYRVILSIILFLSIMTVILGVNIAFYIKNHTEYTQIFSGMFDAVSKLFR